MRKLLVTTSLLLLTSAAIAAAVLMPPGVTLPPAPKTVVPITPEQLSKMSPAELQKHNLGTIVEHPIPGPVPNGKNVAPSPVPPTEAEQHLAKPQPQLPPEHGAPVGEVVAVTSTSVPKGWALCKDTAAAKPCERQAAQWIGEGKNSKVQWLIKLPDSGKVEDLNAFIEAGNKRMTEERPQ